jgi:hypothetical protein
MMNGGVRSLGSLPQRQAGQLLREMAESGERESKGRPDKMPQAATFKLDDLGVSRTQSSRGQKLGALDDDAFEARADAKRKRPPA